MMARFKIILLLTLLPISAFSQIDFHSNKLTQIVYEVSYNGQKLENQNPIWALTDGSHFLISSRDALTQQSDYPFEMSYVDTTEKSILQLGFLNSTDIIGTMDSNALTDQNFELLNETETILGFSCKKAKTVVNSNTIEIWYADNQNLNASPTTLGANLRMLLKVDRNGNHSIEATEINHKSINSLNSFRI